MKGALIDYDTRHRNLADLVNPVDATGLFKAESLGTGVPLAAVYGDGDNTVFREH